MVKDKPATYGRVSRWLHWLSALTITFLLINGYLIANVASEAEQAIMYPVHVLIGWITLILMVIRIVWLFIAPTPEDLPSLSPLKEQLFKWNHILLYIFVILMLVSGLGMLRFSGISLLPGGVTPEAIQDGPPRFAHGTLWIIVALLVLMHLVGLFYYQITEGDSLARMGVNLKKKSSS